MRAYSVEEHIKRRLGVHEMGPLLYSPGGEGEDCCSREAIPRAVCFRLLRLVCSALFCSTS